MIKIVRVYISENSHVFRRLRSHNLCCNCKSGHTLRPKKSISIKFKAIFQNYDSKLHFCVPIIYSPILFFVNSLNFNFNFNFKFNGFNDLNIVYEICAVIIIKYVLCTYPHLKIDSSVSSRYPQLKILRSSYSVYHV